MALPAHRLAVSTTSIPFRCHPSFCNYLSGSTWLLTSNYCYHQLAAYSQGKSHLTQHFRPKNPGHVAWQHRSVPLCPCSPGLCTVTTQPRQRPPQFSAPHPLRTPSQSSSAPCASIAFCIFRAKNLLESQERVSKLKDLNYFPIK